MKRRVLTYSCIITNLQVASLQESKANLEKHIQQLDEGLAKERSKMSKRLKTSEHDLKLTKKALKTKEHVDNKGKDGYTVEPDEC